MHGDRLTVGRNEFRFEHVDTLGRERKHGRTIMLAIAAAIGSLALVAGLFWWLS